MNTFMKGAVFTAPFFGILHRFYVLFALFCCIFAQISPIIYTGGFYMGRPEKFSGLPSFYENPYVFY